MGSSLLTCNTLAAAPLGTSSDSVLWLLFGWRSESSLCLLTSRGKYRRLMMICCVAGAFTPCSSLSALPLLVSFLLLIIWYVVVPDSCAEVSSGNPSPLDQRSEDSGGCGDQANWI